MRGLEKKEEIPGTLGRAVRTLMLHSPPALLMWEKTANQIVQISCCSQAAECSLLLLPILSAILGCSKVKIPGCRQLFLPHFAGRCTYVYICRWYL